MLSHTDYGCDFHLGGTSSVNILTSLTQCLQSFVENKGSPYHFIVVGQLASFKIVEDAVSCILFFCFFFCNLPYKLTQWTISLDISFQSTLASFNACQFSEVFWWQMDTLQKIEEEDGLDSNMHSQVLFSPSKYDCKLCVEWSSSTHNGEWQRDIWFLKPITC